MSGPMRRAVPNLRGVRVDGGTGHTSAGLLARPNNGGICVRGGATVVIGGATAPGRNLVSGNNSFGVRVESAATVTIQGNSIGSNTSSKAALANNGPGLASTVVVASGGFKDKGAAESCRAARSTYEMSFEAYRVDDADGMYPIANSQIIPKYQKAAGGSSATVSGTPEVAVVKGKGWNFTVTYGAADSVVTTGSAAVPVFSAFTPASCAS